MKKTTFTLIRKKELTHDVFELEYSCSDLMTELPLAGQYVMFQLTPWLNRSYSFASYTQTTFTLIIKKIPLGKGSPMICDASLWDVFSGILPLGHFVLKSHEASRCFIGTGTGFAPLYAMILELDKAGIPWKNTFLYGVREERDGFYTEEMIKLEATFGLDFELFFSRDEKSYARKWYVTDWITPENIWKFEEFYICGSPEMVKSARERLESLGIKKESIFFEQY